jgi:hypothetical protein
MILFHTCPKPVVTALVALGLLAASPANAACVTSYGEGFDLKGQVAVDKNTGLQWQRCALGMVWSDAGRGCTGTPLGLTNEEAMKAALKSENGWRVPTAQELDSLFMDSCDGPKIDQVAFPNIAASDLGEGAEFWTSTQVLPPNMYYYFNLTEGYADMHSSGYHLSVFLVRNP